MNNSERIWCAACSMYILTSVLTLHYLSHHPQNSSTIAASPIIAPGTNGSFPILDIEKEDHTPETFYNTTPKTDNISALATASFSSSASLSQSPSASPSAPPDEYDDIV